MSQAHTASHSAIYEGVVHHRRARPAMHAFGMRLSMLYLDLEELPFVFHGRLLWSRERANLAAFHRADYLGDRRRPLDTCVRDVVEEQLGRRPRGAIRMLTQLRILGYCFNPVTIYYCFDEAERLDAVAAQITNTPWKERHTYVFEHDQRAETPHRFRKAFHVSPFMPMEIDYAWFFAPPGESLRVQMTCADTDGEMFHASLAMRRHEISPASLRRVLLRHPLMTSRISLAIHWQALRLWCKRVPFLAHPKKRRGWRAHP